MKKALLAILLAATFTANAQTLKEALYRGKLKMDTNSVIRKTDDLSAKIDTSTKKAEPEKPKVAAASVDSAKNATIPGNAAVGHDSSVVAPDSAAISEPVVAEAEVKEEKVPVKSNTKIWKEYTDSLVTTLKNEVLNSKKIKKETYFFLVEYEIGTDGQTAITNVTCTPENDFLQQQVKDRLLYTPPQLSPTLDSMGKPRKVKRKQSFTVTKE